VLYLKAVGWFLWDLRRPFRGLATGPEFVVTTAYVAGGIAAASQFERVLYQWWVVAAFALGAVLVTAIRQRYELGVNRPHVHILPQTMFDEKGRKGGGTAIEVNSAKEVVREIEFVEFPGVTVKVARAGVVNDPPGLRASTAVTDASVWLRWFTLDGKELFSDRRRLYARWVGSEATNLHDLPPSRTMEHWFNVAVLAERTGKAYVGVPEVGKGKMKAADDFPQALELPSGDLRVLITLSGTGMTRDATRTFRLVNQPGEFRLRRWADGG
jgi:hypothetical protein